VSSWCERRRRRVGGSRPPSPPSPSSRERWSVSWRSSPPGYSSYTRCDHSARQVFFRICLTFLSQCWGSVPFWCGSGSPDPYLPLMDPDPDTTLSSVIIRMKKTYNLSTGTLSSVLKIKFFAKILCLTFILQALFKYAQHIYEKWEGSRAGSGAGSSTSD
jgi:hypothetical protein